MSCNAGQRLALTTGGAFDCDTSSCKTVCNSSMSRAMSALGIIELKGPLAPGTRARGGSTKLPVAADPSQVILDCWCLNNPGVKNRLSNNFRVRFEIFSGLHTHKRPNFPSQDALSCPRGIHVVFSHNPGLEPPYNLRILAKYRSSVRRVCGGWNRKLD